MKKFFASAFIILIFPLMLPLFVHAETTVSTEQFREYFDTYFEVENYTCTDYAIQKYLNYNSGNMYAIVQKNTSSHRFDLYFFDGYTIDGNYLSSRGTDAFISGDSNSGELSTGYNSGYMMSVSNIVIFENKQELIDTVSGGIDYDTLYYNPQIPVPKLDIWYLLTVSSYLEDYDAIVNANIDVQDNTEFFIELAWKWSTPQQIRVYSSDIKGTPAYDYEYYESSDLMSIYSLQDQQQPINLHISGSDLKQVWQDYYDTYYDNINFYTTSNNVPNSWLANARLAYIKKMGTQLPMYGNRLEIFARYWTLTENNEVVVGKWYHWQSAKGSATIEPPSNYVNYQELPGYAGTVDDVPSGSEDTYTGTGETTGEQATTIINYAPNYPDYPTAVSYNHDNILLQMIQTSKQLPQFFGQFTNFLAITLAFIDPGVWAIIGFGFTCCIVIMIIKVL